MLRADRCVRNALIMLRPGRGVRSTLRMLRTDRGVRSTPIMLRADRGVGKHSRHAPSRQVRTKRSRHAPSRHGRMLVFRIFAQIQVRPLQSVPFGTNFQEFSQKIKRCFKHPQDHFRTSHLYSVFRLRELLRTLFRLARASLPLDGAGRAGIFLPDSFTDF